MASENIKIICWDAGHGGKDPGATGPNKREEADDVLKLVLAAGKQIERDYVCKSVYTRTNDIYESPSKKAQDANRFGSDLVVSCHRNDASSATANGFEALLYNDYGIKYELAKMMCEKMEHTGFKNRGVKFRTDLAILRRTIAPSILFEFGFMDNTKDNRLFDKKFDEIVDALVVSIADVMKLKKRENDVIEVGDKVKIKAGAVYAGAHEGKKVSDYALGLTHTVSKIEGKNALLKEINSWVNVKYLTKK